MKYAARTYTKKQESSKQECIYHFLSGLCLRKRFPGAVFANAILPKKYTKPASVKTKLQNCQKSKIMSLREI